MISIVPVCARRAGDRIPEIVRPWFADGCGKGVGRPFLHGIPAFEKTEEARSFCALMPRDAPDSSFDSWEAR
jgi:hypothetical protein